MSGSQWGTRFAFGAMSGSKAEEFFEPAGFLSSIAQGPRNDCLA